MWFLTGGYIDVYFSNLLPSMKTKTLTKNKVNVVTIVFQNLYDSEVMMAQLKANKFEVEHESKINDAGIVIINTCGFIENAKEESINTIIDFVEAKKNGWLKSICFRLSFRAL